MSHFWPNDEASHALRNMVAFRCWDWPPADRQQANRNRSTTATRNQILPAARIKVEVDFSSEILDTNIIGLHFDFSFVIEQKTDSCHAIPLTPKLWDNVFADSKFLVICYIATENYINKPT